ncbi:hypothetical protein Avbf_15655 [Armadillidium vulgare]|nr:hypothetical protein Avbf_15655 [Armadillidium vulgare]
MTILKSNTINITKLKTSTVIRTPLETRATNKNSFKISATKMTSQTDVVNMTSSRQKENGKLRQGKWQAMNKVSETKERRNLNTNSHFETSSSKLKFKFPRLVNISWLFVLMCCLHMVADT